MKLYNICLFVSGLFHLACLQSLYCCSMYLNLLLLWFNVLIFHCWVYSCHSISVGSTSSDVSNHGSKIQRRKKSRKSQKESWICCIPWWLSGKESTGSYRRCRFNPCVGKIPWRRKWQPTPVFLPEEFHKQRSLVDYGVHEAAKISDTIVTKKQQVTISIAFTLY